MSEYKAETVDPGVVMTVNGIIGHVPSDTACPSCLPALQADLTQLLLIRRDSQSTGHLDLLVSFASSVQVSDLDPQCWDFLMSSPFFHCLAKDLDHTPWDHCSETTQSAFFLIAEAVCESGWDQLSVRLSQTAIFRTVYEHLVTLYDAPDADPLWQLCCLLRVSDPEFAEVLRFVHSTRETFMSGDELLCELPCVLQNHLELQTMEWEGVFLQPHLWFYAAFIDAALDYVADAERCPSEGQEAFSSVIVLAIVRLRGALRDVRACAPLNSLPHYASHWFRVSFELKRSDKDFTADALSCVTDLVQKVWVPEAEEARRLAEAEEALSVPESEEALRAAESQENLRDVLYDLCGIVTEIVHDEDLTPVREAGLRFFLAFAGHCVYCADDEGGLRNLLDDLEDWQHGELGELAAELHDRFFSDLPTPDTEEL
jgi:hypothetical protein